MNEGQGPGGYDPLTRVELRPCTGNSWCELGESRYPSRYRSEPESGFTFDAHFTIQGNLRLGVGGSTLHPRLGDITVPLYWYSMGSSAGPKILRILAQMQGSVVLLESGVRSAYLLGPLLVTLSCACLAMSACLCQRHTEPKFSDASKDKV
mmetsp:Transcript_65556/g.181737  ORF Transcript_65556/g.181737 Transcript_65556/m.181737 type:complete len:151 (-) Transcript_65556:32-484(-)